MLSSAFESAALVRHCWFCWRNTPPPSSGEGGTDQFRAPGDGFLYQQVILRRYELNVETTRVSLWDGKKHAIHPSTSTFRNPHPPSHYADPHYNRTYNSHPAGQWAKTNNQVRYETGQLCCCETVYKAITMVHLHPLRQIHVKEYPALFWNGFLVLRPTLANFVPALGERFVFAG